MNLNIPHHSSQRLSKNIPHVIAQRALADSVVEFISVNSSIFNVVVKQFLVIDCCVFFGRLVCKLESHDNTAALSRNLREEVVCSRLGSRLVWVDEPNSSVLLYRSRRRFNDVLRLFGFFE